MSTKIIFKNIFWLSGAEFIVRALKFLLIVLAVRILGAQQYGKFALALSFVSLFAVLSDLGIGGIMVREFSQDISKEKEFYSLFSFKLLLGIVVLLLIIGSTFFLIPTWDIRKITIILGGTVFFNALIGSFYGYFVARQKMNYQAIVQILGAILLTAAGVKAVFSRSLENLSWSYTVAAGFSFLMAWLIFSLKISSLKLEFNTAIWKKYLTLSWPLALAGILGGLYGNIDSVMMGYLKQITQVGWYSASYKIVGIALLPLALIGQGFFPALSSAFKKSAEEFQKIFSKFFEATIALGIPIGIGGIILATGIIRTLYGVSYLPSVLSFQVLMIMVSISYFYFPFSQFLIIANRQKQLFWISFLGVVVDVFLNMILIPKYSLNGAAVATLLSTLLTFLVLFLVYRRLKNRMNKNNRPGILTKKTITAIVVATSIMSSLLILLKDRSFHIYWIVIIGAGVYFGFYILTQKLLSIFVKNNIK